MSKSYADELARLEETFTWAVRQDITDLSGAIKSILNRPLLITGSGGSLSVAHLVAFLHQRYVGELAKAITPLELAIAPPRFDDIAVLLLSAGGRNPDILATFRNLLTMEARYLIVMCSNSNSPLARLASKNNNCRSISFNVPSGKDGFLATNSIIAFSVILCRAYLRAIDISDNLPISISALTYSGQTETQYLIDLKDKCQALTSRDHVIVLYSSSTSAAAQDLESKFSEAALGTVQVTDYRNFAHGRHYWLARHSATTAILSFITDDDRDIADRTLELLPKDIPILRFNIPYGGICACLASIIQVLQIVRYVGDNRGINLSKPGVPLFGRNLYHLPILKSQPHISVVKSNSASAIMRKTNTDIRVLVEQGKFEFWENAYKTYLHKLRSTLFQGVVFDYDGTLCNQKSRTDGLNSIIAHELNRLLEGGIKLGIATGRGKSVRHDLQKVIHRHLWPHILIGYYNGADISELDDNTHPDISSPVHPSLLIVMEILTSNTKLTSMIESTVRPMQITIESKFGNNRDYVWETVFQIVSQLALSGVRTLQSGHSIDILAPGTSKLNLVKRVKSKIPIDIPKNILCIGDRGRWPGNDIELLSEPFSLSVDTVSPEPEVCWNLAPPGIRYVDATLVYLKSINLLKGMFKLRIQEG